MRIMFLFQGGNGFERSPAEKAPGCDRRGKEDPRRAAADRQQSIENENPPRDER